MRIKAVDSRFKKVDKKKVIASLHDHRTSGTLLTSEDSSLEEARYLRELR